MSENDDQVAKEQQNDDPSASCNEMILDCARLLYETLSHTSTQPQRVDPKAAERSRLYRERHKEVINQRRRELRQYQKQLQKIQTISDEPNYITLETLNKQQTTKSHTIRQQRYYERHREEINKRKRDKRQKKNGSQNVPTVPATPAERNRKYRQRKRQEINERRRYTRHQRNIQQLKSNRNNLDTEQTTNKQNIVEQDHPITVNLKETATTNQQNATNVVEQDQHPITVNLKETATTNQQNATNVVEQDEHQSVHIHLKLEMEDLEETSIVGAPTTAKAEDAKMEQVYIKTEQIEIEIVPELPLAIEPEFKREVQEEGQSYTTPNIATVDVKIEKTEENIPQEPFNDGGPECVDFNAYNNLPLPYLPEQLPTPTETFPINGKVYENGKINRLSCSQCDKTFKNRANLKNHLKYVHSDNHSVECTQCFRTFKSHGHLRSHLDSVHAKTEEVNCHICDKVFLNQKKLKNHIYFTHPEPGEQVTCTVCSKVYKSQYNLKIHMRQVHPEGQSVPCPSCDKVFKVDMLLQRHIKWSHPDDGMVYKCQQCFKVLPSLACYKKHIENTHDINSRATCELCKRVFKTKKSLDRHLKNVHNGKEVKAYVPSNFVCTYCERTFESNTTLFWHTQKYHLEGMSGCETDISFTHCEICNKTYSDNASLQRHLASVHSLETATCKICMKEFKSAINLQSHIRITHAPPEAIQHCETCKKTFKCALHLRMHINAVHTEGDFKCDVCEKTFASAKYMNKHKKTHIETRDFPCDLCGKMFKTFFAANKHKKNVHSGVKCCFCNIKQANIKDHLLKCPKKSDEVENLKCTKCGLGFKSTELQQHMVSCGTEGIDPIVKIEVETETILP